MSFFRPLILPLIACWAIIHGAFTPTHAAPLAQEAYVWQRDWNPAVRQAVLERGKLFAGLTVLAAEVSWKKDGLLFEPLAIDEALLEGIKTKVTLAVRINTLPGGLGYQPQMDAEVHRLLGVWWERSKTAQGLQIDFDCPESKLEGYSRWLKQLRTQLPGVRLTITTLPSWLRQVAFGDLVKATDGYVLQVHSLARPVDFATTYTLCDPTEAKQAVTEASRIGVPFAVALPTYGYLLAFTAQGKFIGLSAEGPRTQWPVGSKLKTVRADADALAGLVRDWTLTPPEHCTGLIWYRLPVQGDALNWSWPTLQAVIAGRTPKADISTELRHPEARLVEVDLRNQGEADGMFPRELVVRARGARMVAGDGLQGYEAVEQGVGEWVLRRTVADRLRPGERRMVGWVRLSEDGEVRIEISKN